MPISKRLLIPLISGLLIGGLVLSAVFLQLWVDNEVQKQLGQTETEINSILITNITSSPIAANLTINISATNPHNLVVTIEESELKILYEGSQLGVIHLPRIIIEEYCASLVFNTTFELTGVSWIVWGVFLYDFLYDDEVTVQVTGPLTMHAPAWFITVTTTIIYDTEITMTSEGIT